MAPKLRLSLRQRKIDFNTFIVRKSLPTAAISMDTMQPDKNKTKVGWHFKKIQVFYFLKSDLVMTRSKLFEPVFFKESDDPLISSPIFGFNFFIRTPLRESAISVFQSVHSVDEFLLNALSASHHCSMIRADYAK